MKDVQNIRGDFKFNLNKVGVNNLLHPVTVKTKDGKLISTVGRFTMSVNLDKTIKGINMSRLPILLSELNENKWILDDLKNVLQSMRETMTSDNAYMEIEFDYFIKKKAPVSGFEGIMPYKCKIESSIIKAENNQDESDFILTVEVPVTTLCPCSKEISNYSAHNQRGYVEVSVRYNEFLWIEEIIDIVESVGSCEIYPILKRIDEKYVTERAYENPRFVEDIVRLVSEKLYENQGIIWFRVSSRHQESIHAHDAYAVLEMWK